MFQGDCECLPVVVVFILGALCDQKRPDCQGPKPGDNNFVRIDIPFSTTKERNMEKDAKQKDNTVGLEGTQKIDQQSHIV
jgi:hypothetical protein